MRLNPHKPWRAKVQSFLQFPRNYHHLCFSFSVLPSHTCCICPMPHGFPQETQRLEILARLQGKAEMKGGRLPTLFSKWRTIWRTKWRIVIQILFSSYHWEFLLSNPAPASHAFSSVSHLSFSNCHYIFNFSPSISLWQQPTPKVLRGSPKFLIECFSK